MNIGIAFERLMDILTPQEFKKDLQTQKKIRMFIYSHAFGPFIGLTIPFTLLFIDEHPWPQVPILALSIAAFWPFLILLRMFPGAYVQLSLISVCNVAFALLWGCYYYGGASSPFLAWMVLVPLLTFLYIGSSQISRVFVLALVGGGLAALYLLYRLEGFPQLVDPADMVLPGLASAMGVVIYTYMMSLYYTNVVDSQSGLVREIERHKSTMSALVLAKDVAEEAQKLAESERTAALRAQAEAERANAEKTMFLARMSHELRTPLNAVLGYSELLLEDTSRIRPEDEISDLKRIGAAGKHLLAMVNDVLDIARIEAGKAHIYSDPVDLDRLLEELAGTMMPAMRENNNRFVLHAEGRLGTIMGDGTKIRQAIINLVANAAKFTKDGIVALKARRYVMEEESWLDIAVSDTGIGISADDQKKLFTNFTQANKNVAVNYGGSGLGLSLSQNLCRLMGGSISLHSVPGNGSTFTIHLPLNEAADDEPHHELDPVIFEPEGRKPFNATAHRIVSNQSPKPEYDAMVEEATAGLHEKVDGFGTISNHLRSGAHRIVSDHEPKGEFDAMLIDAEADLHEKIHGYRELSSAPVQAHQLTPDHSSKPEYDAMVGEAEADLHEMINGRHPVSGLLGQTHAVGADQSTKPEYDAMVGEAEADLREKIHGFRELSNQLPAQVQGLQADHSSKPEYDAMVAEAEAELFETIDGRHQSSGPSLYQEKAHVIAAGQSVEPGYDPMVEEAVADLHERIDGFHQLSSLLPEQAVRPLVLVCDLDHHYLSRMEGDLRQAGYAPLTTDDASLVLGLARAATPRAVMISDRLEATTQVKLLQIFSADPVLYNIPVIMISATRPTQANQNLVSGHLPFSASGQELKGKLNQVISDNPNDGYLIRANSR